MLPSLTSDPSAGGAPARRGLSLRRIILRAVLLILLVLALCWLAWVGYVAHHLPPHQVKPGPDTLRVLFIGNSYTFVNDLPGLVMALSAGEARPVDAEMVVESGATLDGLWAEGKAPAAIQRGGWDYVVLQEQSTLGSGRVVDGIDQIGDPASLRRSVRRFAAAIRQSGAQTVLFLTWARQDAPQNQPLLNSAYHASARDVQALVAPVGPAWLLARQAGQGWGLYQDDGSHPNAAGSYLAACVFYATFYDKSPEGLPGRVSGSLVDASGTLRAGSVSLSPADALALQRIAWQAVEEEK